MNFFFCHASKNEWGITKNEFHHSSAAACNGWDHRYWDGNFLILDVTENPTHAHDVDWQTSIFFFHRARVLAMSITTMLMMMMSERWLSIMEWGKKCLLLCWLAHSEQYGRLEDEWNGNERQDSSRVFSNRDECSLIEDWNSSNSLTLLKCELKKLKEMIFSWKVINLIRESSVCSCKARSRTRLKGAALYEHSTSTPSF